MLQTSFKRSQTLNPAFTTKQSEKRDHVNPHLKCLSVDDVRSHESLRPVLLELGHLTDGLITRHLVEHHQRRLGRRRQAAQALAVNGGRVGQAHVVRIRRALRRVRQHHLTVGHEVVDQVGSQQRFRLLLARALPPERHPVGFNFHGDGGRVTRAGLRHEVEHEAASELVEDLQRIFVLREDRRAAFSLLPLSLGRCGHGSTVVAVVLHVRIVQAPLFRTWRCANCRTNKAGRGEMPSGRQAGRIVFFLNPFSIHQPSSILKAGQASICD